MQNQNENQNEEKDRILSNYFYDTRLPAGFSSVSKLYTYAKTILPNLTVQDVQNFLHGEPAYFLHKPVKHNFLRNKIIVRSIDAAWELDLIDFIGYTKENDNYSYIFCIIDSFSKMVWVRPLKTKNKESVCRAFQEVLDATQRTPATVRCDQGPEFNNNVFRKLLADNRIQLYFCKNPQIKCAIIERFIRTIKARLYKEFAVTKTKRWIDTLGDHVYAYNRSHHRTIKMAPIEVTGNNEKQMFRNIYGVDSYRDLIFRKYPKYTLNDDVRVKIYKKDYSKRLLKKFYEKWNPNVKKITKIKRMSTKPVYQVDSGYPFGLYREDLSSARKPKKRKIDQIIDRKVENGVRKYKIKWHNMPLNLATWEDADHLEPYF